MKVRLDPESHLSNLSRMKGIRRVVFWWSKAIGATGAARLRGLRKLNGRATPFKGVGLVQFQIDIKTQSLSRWCVKNA